MSVAGFVCAVDENCKATEIRIWKVWGSAQRNPHMRAFWGATWTFFLAFIGWFAFTQIEVEVAHSLGICENQVYDPLVNPTRLAYLKFKNLNTMLTYCQYGVNNKQSPTDCKEVPAAIFNSTTCNATISTGCVAAAAKQKYRPKVLPACLCTAGTNCAAQLNNAGTASVSSTIITRTFFGVLLERFGVVNTQAGLMIFGSMWVAAGALVNDVWNYILIRFFIGMIGAAFVANQVWNTIMFAPNVVGSANAISAGWGNLGGGVSTLLVSMVLFQPMVDGGVPNDLAWRMSLLVPAGLLLIDGICVKCMCWDSPTSKKLTLASVGKTKHDTVWDWLRALRDPRVLVMMLQYACVFGTELVLYSQLPRHFSSYFQMKASDASAMTSIFGLTNLFSRPCGGIISDFLGKKFGFRGRIWLQFTVLFLEACLLFAFGCIDNEQPIAAAAITLFLFSIFCEAGCGTTFGVVPFMTKDRYTIYAALIGAAGNLGATLFNVLVYKQLTSDELLPIKVHAGIVMFSALLTPIIYYPHLGGMFCKPVLMEGMENSTSSRQPLEKVMEGDYKCDEEKDVAVIEKEISAETATTPSDPDQVAI
jgi:MFS transporter, NNP family, nitrate/nitrite transporter